MRLIDADALKKALNEAWEDNVLSTLGDAVNIITNAPTVQREGWVSVPIEPYIYEVVDADDTYYIKEKPTYKGFYFVKPLYMKPSNVSGMRYVPIEPTDEMLNAVLNGTPYADDNRQLMREAYKAMIQAAPTDTE